MNKGINTKEKIVEKSAELFSKYGYNGCSLSDIMNETNLKKGGSLHSTSHWLVDVRPNFYSDRQSLNLIQIEKQQKKHTIRFFNSLKLMDLRCFEIASGTRGFGSGQS